MLPKGRKLGTPDFLYNECSLSLLYPGMGYPLGSGHRVELAVSGMIRQVWICRIFS